VVGPNGDPPGDVVIHADPAGAAILMREVLALHLLEAALEEHDGDWKVVVHLGSPDGPRLLEVVDLVVRCIDEGQVEFATIRAGKRTYTMQARRPRKSRPATAAPSQAA